MRSWVSGPLLTSPSPTPEDSISPCWGEWESRLGRRSQVYRPHSGGPSGQGSAALPGRLPPPPVGAFSSSLAPARPCRRNCTGNGDHQHLERRPGDLTNPRLIILAFFFLKRINPQNLEMSFQSHQQMPLGSFCPLGAWRWFWDRSAQRLRGKVRLALLRGHRSCWGAAPC